MSNVRDFGARGDGKSDDTEAVRHAVAEAADGIVEFPRGDFLIRKTVEVRLNETGRLALVGDGVGRVVMAGPGPAFRFVGTHTRSADPASFAPGVWQKERMPLLEGLEVVGAHAEADGLEFVYVMQPTLVGCLVRRVRHGVRFAERCRNVLLSACHVYDCTGVGVFLDRVNLHQAVISGCHVSYCKGGGIKVLEGEVRNLHVTGCDVEYNFDPDAKESADVWVIGAEGGVREGSLVGNTIQARVSPGGANIRLVGPADASKVGLWTVSGNHISNQAVNVHLKNCRGVVVSGNTLLLGAERNILVEGCRGVVLGPQVIDHNPDYKDRTADGIRLEDSDGCVVQGVVLDGVTAGSEKEGGAIEVLSCREVSVVGCQVSGPSHRGVYVRDSRNTRVADCTLTDRPGGTMLAAVEVAGRSPGTLVRGNIVGKGSMGDIVAPGAALEGNHQPETISRR
jgi:hypothetical protein